LTREEQAPTIAIQPSPLFKPISTLASTTIDTVRKIEEPEIKAGKSETISSIIESHESETKSEQKFHMKLEHKTPSIVESRIEKTIVVKEVDRDKRDIAEPLTKTDDKATIENENIETSTIARKDALSFFESITKESEILPKGPKEMIKLTEDGQFREAKVGKLTKSYERGTTYQEVKKAEARPSEFQATKKAVQDIFTKLEQGPPRGVENKLFDFPYESPSLEIKKTTMEEKVISDSSISQLRFQAESSEKLSESFNLVPEPPPEICYMPRPDELKKKRPDVSVKAKQLQESFEKTLSPIDAPIGGVKIFPTSTPKVPEPAKPTESIPAFTIPPPFELERKETFEETCIKKDAHERKESKYFKEEKMEPSKYASTSLLRSTSPLRPWSSSSDVETKSHVSTDLSEYRCHSAASSHQETLRSMSPKPSADALAMEKSWAKKSGADSSRKSWPPQTEFGQKREWNIPVDEYKSSVKEFQQKVEETPQGGIKKTSTESSTSIEKRSWSSKEEFTEKVVEATPSPKLGPIIYNAETIKVDHTVTPMQEKALFEKYISECNVEKAETSQKFEEYSSKRWTAEDKELKAPSLVRKIEPVAKTSLVASRRPAETEVDSVVFKPGSPPEIGYIPPPFAKEKTVLEQTTKVERREEPPVLPPKDVRVTPPPVPAKKSAKHSTPVPSRFVKGSFSHESDYESDFDSRPKAKWRPYESDNEEPHYRKVQAPVLKQPTRPRSTEPEPLPPSKFETPALFAGPSRSPAVAESSEKATKKTTFKRHERESKQQQQQTSIPLKPGSPPIYVQQSTKGSAPKPPSVKKPESPKFKTKVFHQESGYMADTDEPFQQKVSTTTTQKFIGKREGSSTMVHTESHTTCSESKTKSFESSSYESDHLRKEESSFVSPTICGTPPASKVVQQQRSSFEKSYASSTSSGLRGFESVKVRDLIRVRVSLVCFEHCFPFPACLN